MICGKKIIIYSSLIVLAISKNFAQKLTGISDSTPLSIEYILDKTNTMPVLIYVQGKTKHMSIAHKYPPYYGTKFAIHGLYPNYTNKIFIQYGTNKIRQFNVKTKAIVIYAQNGKIMPLMTQLKKDYLPVSDIYNHDLFFTSLPNNNYILGFDRMGDIRYVFHQLDKHYIMRMELLTNTITFRLINSNQYYQQIDLMGHFIFNERMKVHHESIPYQDGEIILANSQWGWEDSVFILDHNRKIKKTLLIGDAIRKVVAAEDLPLLNQVIFDNKNIYTNQGKLTRVDWGHANSIAYDKNLDRLYVSLRHQGLLAINMDTWTLEWFLANDNLNIKAGTTYARKPAHSRYLSEIPSLAFYRIRTEGEEPKGQHALFLRKNGNILMFDNQEGSDINTNGSRIVEYHFGNGRHATIAYEYHTPERNYARFVSDIDLTENLNKIILFGYGNPRRILEIDSNDNILFDLEINTKSILYRVDKFPLYPYSDPNKKYSLDYIEK